MDDSLKMVCGAFYIPKDDPSNPQGDDAHFICLEKQTIGIADGVGGWSKYGVDAGQYARQLMANSVDAIQNAQEGYLHPSRILSQAYSKTNVQGSSTACILALKNNRLRVANIGDSGFMLIRKGENVYQSSIQQHSFNCPYQLGNRKSADRPTAAQTYKIPVKSGDVIILGTDGLFDNMFEYDIQQVAKMTIGHDSEPEQVAWAIAQHAYYNSVDRHVATPFTQASLKAGKKHLGGKVDDITVIVAYVVEKID
ncbi:probable protein phosphatase 2C 55 isoform X2 [Camellia sinensis]|uniref:probable protein phosphatase 2C 55 isoform X2 n=1 Tax=Camellia sinensis TaxID=4442 RepID=UPI001035835C|nr:probable protein phosphatase 2C 55 isoform X2 [Camellia sinensis]